MQLGLTKKARTRSFEELKAPANFTPVRRVKLCPLPPRSSKQACGHRAVTIPEEHSFPAARPCTQGLRHLYEQGEWGHRKATLMSAPERHVSYVLGATVLPRHALHLHTSK